MKEKKKHHHILQDFFKYWYGWKCSWQYLNTLYFVIIQTFKYLPLLFSINFTKENVEPTANLQKERMEPLLDSATSSV